jgi:hypothetical protein
MRASIFIAGILAVAGCVPLAAEQPATATNSTTTATEPAKREMFTDPAGGYSLLLPSGYRKLTDDEMHFVFKSLSEYLGKEASERTIKQPPAYFIGTAKAPGEKPPSLTIAFSENDQQFTHAQMPMLKAQLEEQHKRQGDKVGESDIKLVTIDGINSIQVENDYFDQIGNERSRMIRVAVPAKGKWIEIRFIFSPAQGDAVHAALKEALDSLKIMEHPAVNVANQNKWLRIAYITLACGLAGVVLSLILQKFRKS